MKRALVLSGGGAKGAFQFGALQYIYERLIEGKTSCYFNIIAGVSVGALNGVMLAMNGFEQTKRIWQEISNDKVYRGELRTIPAILKIAFGSTSVLSNDPLKSMIDRYVDLRKIDDSCDFRFGAVTLNDGEYHSFSPKDFNNNRDFRAAILASTVMPVIWPPVPQVKDISAKIYRDLVDGGIRNISPLGDVIDEDPDEIVIINCNAAQLPFDKTAASNIFNIAKRSLAEIATNEIFRSDLKEYMKVNYLVQKAAEQGVRIPKKNDQEKYYKEFKTYLIQPDRSLGDALDFSSSTVKSRIALGYEKASEVFLNVNKPDLASGE